MVERRAIHIGGIVQGVGFRPFVYGLASRLNLQGFVKNRTGGVLIEVEGDSGSLECFLRELVDRPPPLAEIDRMTWEPMIPQGDLQFRIEASEADHASQFFISPDVATCPDCVRELFDPADRRYRYPFLNCTNCGPRLTIIRGSPYDRARTTMAGFPMCRQCKEEYEDPSNRRFHAQPTACAACGPSLRLLSGDGTPVECGEPLSRFIEAVAAGRIGAMKGLGGFHLVCDASSESAVTELRRRKHRDEKPFAVMVCDLAAVVPICECSPLERELLGSTRCPIVLLRKKAGSKIVEGVAPSNPYLGVMLPYTPLHHLLMQDAGGRPLVMTSGNQSDEPIAYEIDDALARLRGIADLFLVHDRPIHVRCDDSVTRVVAGHELPLRRSRGYAPQPIRLPFDCRRPFLAVGGQLKGVFAFGGGRHAFLSHHMGDLDHYEAFRAFERDIGLFEQVFDIQPRAIVHDLHPDYASTRYAAGRAQREGLPLLAVQHHHAHMASCMAENGLTKPVIGVTFDGTGFGPDGAVWGGEFLLGDYRQWRRAAHFRYVGLPGGDQAIREPWRMAVAYLTDAECELSSVEAAATPVAVRMIQLMLQRRLNTPPTSSAGRLFDAVAAIVGLRHRVSYEGQAAVELEWAATEAPPDGNYSFDVCDTPSADESSPPLEIDFRPMIRAIVADAIGQTDRRTIARRFHSTLAEMIVDVCGRIRKATAVNDIVLSGGVFLNALLTELVLARLDAAGFNVYRHRLVPPNDGGLSLGQIAVAAQSDFTDGFGS